MLASPPWYRALERRLEPSWPAMVGLSVAIVGVTGWLLWKRKAVPMAGWLTYLVMP